MPRRLVISSFVCVLYATLVPSPGRAEAAPRLPGRVESPVKFVLPPRPEPPTLAEQAVRGSGLKWSRREEKGRVDAAAAAIILQAYLRREANRG